MKIQKSLDTTEIGSRIKKLRKARSMKQDELGYVLRNKETNVPLSRSQVSNLERGRRNINIHQLKVLADFFNVSLETLGVTVEDVEIPDLLSRATLIFKDENIPLEQKQDLYEEIMKLYVSAKEQIKKQGNE